jgi:hypothetical protein
MPYISPDSPLSLLHNIKKGNGECAGIAQSYVPGLIPRPDGSGPHASDWIRGAKVRGRSIQAGTVIAIFDSNGVYVGQKHHAHKSGIAHVALYVQQSAEGIEVVHQHAKTDRIKGTLIRFGGGWLGDVCTNERADGYHKSGVSGKNISRQGITLEDDADNYYVVELRPAAASKKPKPEDFAVHVSGTTALNR